MTQVFVAAWIGVTVGWIGFGLVLAEAPGEMRMAAAQAQGEPSRTFGVGMVRA